MTRQDTDSPWNTVRHDLIHPPLVRNAGCDVCVVGAGIAGLSTAYLLAKEGLSVVLLDDGPVGGGMTCMTTAHLTNALDDRYSRLRTLVGDEHTKLAAAAHTAAIARIRQICLHEAIACDFKVVDGYLFVPPGDPVRILDEELAATHAAGLLEVERLLRAPIPSFDTGPCLRFPGQAQFHPMKYMAGLAIAARKKGVRIHTNTRAEKIESGHPAKVVTTNGPVVTAGSVVVATNVPFVSLVSIPLREAAYMTYVVAGAISKGSVPPALFWDTAHPYHFIRTAPLSPDQDLLLVGGEDARTGQHQDGDDRFRRLEAWARERFPALGAVEFRWSGQVMETQDGLAYIGPNPGDEDNVFIATGDSGMGLTHGTIAGMLLTDLVQGKANAWSEVFSPSRLKLLAAGGLIRENLKMSAQYAQWLTPGEVGKPEDVQKGSGAIVRSGLTKLAVSRDDEGRLHICSAVCPHLGCIVQWNANERTWDCPCHGSRFQADGKVMNGPANADLAKPSAETKKRPPKRKQA